METETDQTDTYEVTCFLDESATDGSLPYAVVGGLILTPRHYEDFRASWTEMLDEFNLWPGLHMKEFVRKGRFKQRPTREKKIIFERAVQIIDECKVYSLSCCLGSKDYKAVFSADTQYGHSQYELCFILSVIGNARMAEFNKYAGPISFVMDNGNSKAEQVKRAFNEIKNLESALELPIFRLGSLDFKDDEKECALQAADIIAWGARRKVTGAPLRSEFEPIDKMISEETTHNTSIIGKQSMGQLEAHFQDQLRKLRLATGK